MPINLNTTTMPVRTMKPEGRSSLNQQILESLGQRIYIGSNGITVPAYQGGEWSIDQLTNQTQESDIAFNN